MKITDLSSFNAAREAGLAKLLPAKPRIAIGMGTCGSGNGAEGIYHAFADTIEMLGLGFTVSSALIGTIIGSIVVGRPMAATTSESTIRGATPRKRSPTRITTSLEGTLTALSRSKRVSRTPLPRRSG